MLTHKVEAKAPFAGRILHQTVNFMDVSIQNSAADSHLFKLYISF